MQINTWKKSSRSNGNGGNNCVEVYWKKSSRSNPSGNCVSVRWQKSSRSGANSDNCVEVRTEDERILVRDTKLGEASPILSFSTSDWQGFLLDVTAGYDWPAFEAIKTAPGGEHYIQMWDNTNGFRGQTVLSFTEAEWIAFSEGVKLGEFDLQPA